VRLGYQKTGHHVVRSDNCNRLHHDLHTMALHHAALEHFRDSDVARADKGNEEQSVAQKPAGQGEAPDARELDDVCIILGVQLHVETGFVYVFKAFGLFGGCTLGNVANGMLYQCIEWKGGSYSGAWCSYW
jgi:hypothetical protein